MHVDWRFTLMHLMIWWSFACRWTETLDIRKPYPIEDDPGCRKCGKCRVSCPVIVEGSKFTSTNTQRTYKIRKNLNCDSSYVIYLATCKNCKGQYVGKSTTPFKKRHSNHKQEIKKKYGGLRHHYGGDGGWGYQNFSVQIIDQVEKGDTVALADKEVFWQNQIEFIQTKILLV